MTSLIPGLIRQPWKLPLQTFSNALKFRKSADISAVLSYLPVPGKVDQTGVPVTAAMEAGMLQRTHVTQDRTRHPGYPAVQLLLTCDQILTGSELLHVKYCAREKERKSLGTMSNIIYVLSLIPFQKVEL